MLQYLTWCENYITTHEQLDNYHKGIFNLFNENLILITNPEKNQENINEISQKFVSLMLEHIDVESCLLAHYKILNYKKHLISHNDYKERIKVMQKYDIPILISTITICSVVYEYFDEHFYSYDKIQLPLLKEKVKKTE